MLFAGYLTPTKTYQNINESKIYLKIPNQSVY
jgi:hypothetical protein